VGDTEAEDFLLPKSLVKKTFADASKKLSEESKERELDRISKLGKDTMLARLAITQETMREDPNNMFAEGGKLTRLNSLINKPVQKSLIQGGNATMEFIRNAYENVDPMQLNAGIRVEMEHTNDPKKAREIALDHLIEKPDYYTLLVGSGIADEKIPNSVLQGLGLNNEERESAEQSVESMEPQQSMMAKGGKLLVGGGINKLVNTVPVNESPYIGFGHTVDTSPFMSNLSRQMSDLAVSKRNIDNTKLVPRSKTKPVVPASESNQID